MDEEKDFIKKWLKQNLDWQLLDCIALKAVEKIHCTEFFQIFYYQTINEEIEDWIIKSAFFYDVDPSIIDYDIYDKFYTLFFALLGITEVNFKCKSGLSFKKEIEFSTHYTLEIKKPHLFKYQTNFFVEEIGFPEAYSTSDT